MSGRKIQDAIRQIAGTFNSDEVNIVLATVQSVDEDAMTCDVTTVTGTAIGDVPGVQLMAEVDDGFLLIPAVGSNVLVTITKRGIAYVSMFSEVAKLSITAGSSVLAIKDQLVQLNDGSYGGLVQIKQLVTKLNNLEADLNKIKTAFTSWVTVPNDGGAALKTVSASWAGSQITPTQQSDLENSSITHGI